MLATMSQAEYLGWQRYWRDEPWGPYRDNLHTALLAREIRRPQLIAGASIDLDDFMIRRAIVRAADRVTGFVRSLFAMSKPKKPGPKAKG